MATLKIFNSPLSYDAPVKETGIEDFIGKLFWYSTALKFLHLKVSGQGSFAQHLAVGELYDFTSSLVDTLVETAQTETLMTLCHERVCSTDVNINVIKEFETYVSETRYVFMKSFQRNLIDTLEEKIALTLYKLKFLS